jgi:hypothetical protein
MTFSSNIPGTGAPDSDISFEGGTYTDDGSYPWTRWMEVSPAFFKTVGVEPLIGRTFESRDALDGDIPVVVNQSFARTFFPEGSPIGRRMRTGRGNATGAWMTIVGVTPDIPMAPLDEGDSWSTNHGFYRVFHEAQEAPMFRWMLIRTRGNPLDATGDVRAALRDLDPDIALAEVRSMRQAIALQTWFFNVLGSLFIAFGIGALFLSAVGQYGIMAFSVRNRTTEIGIRMTLGATEVGISRMVLKEGLMRLAIGMAAGFALAIVLARSIQLILFDTLPGDPMTFVLVAAGMICIGFLASYIPARRAASLNPLDAIRHE